jgi:hypothetical protein
VVASNADTVISVRITALVSMTKRHCRESGQRRHHKYMLSPVEHVRLRKEQRALASLRAEMKGIGKVRIHRRTFARDVGGVCTTARRSVAMYRTPRPGGYSGGGESVAIKEGAVFAASLGVEPKGIACMRIPLSGIGYMCSVSLRGD